MAAAVTAVSVVAVVAIVAALSMGDEFSFLRGNARTGFGEVWLLKKGDFVWGGLVGL